MYGKNQIFSQSIKKETNRLLIIIESFLFCLSVLRALKKFCSIQYMNFWKKMVLSVNIDQVSDLQILVNIGYFQLCMIFMHLLIVIHPLDVKGIFLDISKSFDRVGHDGLIYNIKCIVINSMSQIDDKFFEKWISKSCFKDALSSLRQFFPL